MAAVYSDRGYGLRPPVVFYNRANEAAAQLKPGISTGRRSLQVACAGCTAADSLRRFRRVTAALAAEMMREAKAAGAVTSFDLNFREKLWNIQAAPSARLRPSAALSRRGCAGGQRGGSAKGLGIPGPEVAAKSKLDPSIFLA